MRAIDRAGGEAGGHDDGDRRICIVGAGASGLAVAQALRRRGYRHITLLERDTRIGGKCWTIEHEGHAYELGAGGLTLRYRHVRALMAETHLRKVPLFSQAFVDLERRDFKRMPLPLMSTLRALGPEGARFAHALWRHRAVGRPGFVGLGAELCRPFADWCRDEGVATIGELVRPWTTGFGYGFHDDVPAAYVLKFVSLWGSLFEIPEGYGELWRRVAATLDGVDIRLGTSITAIRRDDDGIRVDTNGGALAFDVLVLACPLDEALPLLDASATEQELFSRIRHHDYYVVGVVADGLPRQRCLFFPRHFAREHIGQPMFAYQRWPPHGLTCFYGFARDSDDERDAVRATVERLGGRLRAMPVATRWRFFPHVGADDMAAGYYTRLESLQGTRATYYCGELLAFSCVETVVGHARALVERHFAPRRALS
jgi:predicted NAD/FAD-binding protein